MIYSSVTIVKDNDNCDGLVFSLKILKYKQQRASDNPFVKDDTSNVFEKEWVEISREAYFGDPWRWLKYLGHVGD
jgi:hypothetical protein